MIGPARAEVKTFHDRMGYCCTATIPEVDFKFGRYLDLVLMQKFL